MTKLLFLSCALFTLVACEAHQDIGSCGDDLGCISRALACENVSDGDPCTLSSGETGTCEAGSCATPLCTPTMETCNGTDDDCNGIVDDAPGCGGVCAGQPDGASCTTNDPTGLVLTGSCLGGQCVVVEDCIAEVCNNGIDDDCNGIVDDGCSGICAGVPEGATCTWQDAGGVTHTGVCRLGECEKIDCGPELCNGLDDDCNGVIDDAPGCGGVCAGQPDGTSCTIMDPTGNLVGQCFGGVCEPDCSGPEICNGADDDCDGTVDNGLVCLSSCAGMMDGTACTATVNGVPRAAFCENEVCTPAP